MEDFGFDFIEMSAVWLRYNELRYALRACGSEGLITSRYLWNVFELSYHLYVLT